MKNKKNPLVKTVRIYQEAVMEFAIEKCAMHIREIAEGIELTNQESIKTIEEKENFKNKWKPSSK